MLGFLYFGLKYPSGDGDVLKAAYLLTTAPAWALAFAAAIDVLLRSRRAAIAAAVLLGCCAAVDVTFLVYRP
jgi:hypothetical protein